MKEVRSYLMVIKIHVNEKDSLLLMHTNPKNVDDRKVVHTIEGRDVLVACSSIFDVSKKLVTIKGHSVVLQYKVSIRFDKGEKSIVISKVNTKGGMCITKYSYGEQAKETCRLLNIY